MIKINLLPVKAARKKEKVLTQLYVGILVIVFTLAGLAYRYISQKSRIETVDKQIQETAAQIEKLREAQKKFEELKRKKELLEKQIEAISRLDKGRDWFIRVLDKVGESVPRNQLWLTQVKLGGGKSGRARRGGGGAGDHVFIKGNAYSRDAVAHFMGNLSIIPCDDELPEEEKHPVCRMRNERCRKWNEQERNYEWDFEGCRRFYKEVCDEVKSCKEDLEICEFDEKRLCKESPQGKECKEMKQKCAETKERCEQAQDNCQKLHEEEYIVYDSVSLNYISTGKGKQEAGGVPVYSFEIECRATSPR